MTFGSLFAGIGGFDLGLERAGMTVRWQVEVDPYARGILDRRWPDVPRRGDIRLVDPADLPSVDLICGGFPCQDISSAGKGVGIIGRRSGLWKEMLRLVSGLRPRWILAENVPALRTRGADVVLADLEAEGYACWPVVVGARHVGAPHRRDRVWIVGYADRARREGAGVNAHERRSRLGDRRGGVADAERGGVRNESRWCGGTARPRAPFPASPGEPQHEWEPPRTTQPRVGRFADGFSRRLALKALGNAVVPQVAEVIGRAIMECANA